MGDKSMNEIEKRLSFLLSRLAWPSGMVRERACIALADLLLDTRWSKITEKSLIGWIRIQILESMSAIGLIIFLYTKVKHADYELPPKEEMVAAITRPSLLSHIILGELFSEDIIPIDSEAMNSGQCPNNFRIDPFFRKYSRNFLPPIYMDTLEHLESKFDVPLTKQWAFEWTKILEAEHIIPSEQALNFLYENQYSDYTTVRDVYLSEVYRSAYLRTISWLVSSKRISEITGTFYAIQTCPIDLGLWSLRHNERPDWWPLLKKLQESIDIPTCIWDLVNEIWDRQLLSKDEWVIAEASGYVYRENILYDLEINGFFQKISDKNTYDLELLSDRYRMCNEISYDPFDRGLNFQGIIESRSIHSFMSVFGDLIPASCSIWPFSIPRWQFWRMYRGIWFPNPCISPCLAFKCSNKAIIILDKEDILGKWIDWRDILREKSTANLPPLTGQYLIIKKDKVDAFMQKNNLTFCWICRLIKYQRDADYKEYTTTFNYHTYDNKFIDKLLA